MLRGAVSRLCPADGGRDLAVARGPASMNIAALQLEFSEESGGSGCTLPKSGKGVIGEDLRITRGMVSSRVRTLLLREYSQDSRESPKNSVKLLQANGKNNLF